MTIKIAINGFGRIGRQVLRALYESNRDDIKIIAINDLTTSHTLEHLLKYDSVHGRFPFPVSLENDTLKVNDDAIRLTAEKDPSRLDWSDVDVVCECTGVFRSKEKAELLLQSGAKKILISAPGSDIEKTIVYGVNDAILTASDYIVSNASCTTNCLAPVAKVLDDNFSIKTGYMTTVHSYTSDQPNHDRPHSDLFRARASALSMIPTSTGAASAISLVLPNLKGKLEGSAIRVPTANVSLVDLCVMLEKEASVESVNMAFEKAAKTALQGILAYDTDAKVSIDYNHDSHSSTIAAHQTCVTQDGMVRIVSWYDNEWGFSNRMLDTAYKMGSL